MLVDSIHVHELLHIRREASNCVEYNEIGPPLIIPILRPLRLESATLIDLLAYRIKLCDVFISVS
jgi:hypothetical protein